MQLFFNTPSPISYGVLRYTRWDYVRNGLLRNLETTQNYYYDRIYSVKGNHFIARLINTINVSHNFELERFYDIVDAKANIIAGAMRMTSSLQRGSLFDGVFYGQGCTEIVMNDSNSFDPFYVFKNWKTTQAVKVILHPRSDLSLMLPNGKTTGTETGLAVISVNIPMLAIQYKAFAANQINMNVEDDIGLQTVAHFVHRYVLPNMLPSQLDITIFNRISNILNGAPMGESTRAHPFMLVDYSAIANQVQTEIVKDMVGRNMDYKSITATIPAVTKPNMEQVLTIPDNAPTRQVLWAEVLSRIGILQTIVTMGGNESIHKNMTILNAFAREFKQYQSDKAISFALPRDIYLDTFEQMQEIAKLAGKTLIA
jgi:hypothetical protein